MTMSAASAVTASRGLHPNVSKIQLVIQPSRTLVALAIGTLLARRPTGSLPSCGRPRADYYRLATCDDTTAPAAADGSHSSHPFVAPVRGSGSARVGTSPHGPLRDDCAALTAPP